MNWEKGGRIFVPSGDRWWARHYTHLPTAHVRPDGTVRVYFAGLDEKMFGRVGYVDVDAADPSRVLTEAEEPVLDLGEVGSFEDSGVVPSSIVETDDSVLLYYHGFQRAERVPYMIFSGLAVSSPKGSPFVRHARTPLLDRTPDEPFLRAASYVIFEDGRFRMWYVSCTHWSRTDDKLHYNNEIRHATSDDGIHWTVDPHVCLGPLSPDEYSVGRPCVIRLGGEYHLWYSSRSHSRLYTIEHATSPDGLHWERDADLGLEKSAEGWDSEVICYANIVRCNGRWVMFYNGNRHGRSGFGYAVLRGAA